jgi:hypothetical protein
MIDEIDQEYPLDFLIEDVGAEPPTSKTVSFWGVAFVVSSVRDMVPVES